MTENNRDPIEELSEQLALVSHVLGTIGDNMEAMGYWGVGMRVRIELPVTLIAKDGRRIEINIPVAVVAGGKIDFDREEIDRVIQSAVEDNPSR